MIVQVKDSYVFKEQLKESSKQFFEEYGRWKESESYLSDEDKANGIKPKIRVEYEFIGHIDLVPIEILNDHSRNITFYKGVKSLAEKAIGGSIEETKSLNNGVINIHLPSNELFSVNETLLLEDSCTDKLQRELDNGFRIIACIPRAGQRRPDYILGRNNNGKSNDTE